MKEKEPIKQEFTVLQDKPLENGESDIFGHGEIANSVIEVIRKAPSLVCLPKLTTVAISPPMEK